MHTLINQIQIQVNSKIYKKDPTSSDLGNKIISSGIKMIEEIGLEHFTFGKLAKELRTTESSIYRYFENKHMLLLYLISWYWGWLEYQLVFSTVNVTSAEDKLKAAIDVIAKEIKPGEHKGLINVELLKKIIVSESSKAYLIKEVDNANKEGFYSGYKRLVTRLADIILEINTRFKNPHTLASTIIEGIYHQKYFAKHLPSLTDIDTKTNEIGAFYLNMALSTVKRKKT